MLLKNYYVICLPKCLCLFPGHFLTSMSGSQSRHAISRAAVPHSFWSPRSTKHTSVNGSTSNISAAEWMHGTKGKKLRPASPRQRVKYNISVNRRPCSASDVTGMLENSPYSLCVAPHLHKPHKITPRPASARIVNH